METHLPASELNVVRVFLDAQSTLALATVDADGSPQVAPLFYVSDEALNLYWLSSATSRHSINLDTQSRVAATVYPDVWDWKDIRGLQIEGTASAVEDRALRGEILVRYNQKFDLPPGFEAVIADSGLYALKPTWMRWLNNSAGFGYKVDFDF